MIRRSILTFCAGAMICALLFTGCVNIPPAGSPAPTQQAENSPAPDVTPTATPSPLQSGAAPTQTQPKITPAPQYSYAIAGTKILRTNKESGEKSEIYDAKKHYASSTELVSIRKLLQDGDALYFLEYGGLKDPMDSDIPSTDSIVRIGKDGGGRKVLASVNGITGYTEFVLFHDRIFYVEDGFDSCAPGDITTDGSGKDELWKAYAKEHNVSTDCLSATMRLEGGKLIIEADFYSLDFLTNEMHVISVDANMKMTTVSIKKPE